MKFDELVGYSGSAFNTVLAVGQANHVLQILEYALAIVSFGVTTAYTIWKWHNRATAKNSDGGSKITKDEVKELFDDIKNKKEDQ